MFVATIDQGARKLCQGVIVLRWPSDDMSGRFEAWRRHSALVSQSWPLLSTYVRLDILASGQTYSTYAFTALVDRLPYVRAAIAALVRTDGISGSEVIIPGTADAFLENYADADDEQPRAHISTADMVTSSGTRLQPLPLTFDVLPALVSAARHLEQSMSYECAIIGAQPDRATLRDTLVAQDRLEREHAVPVDIVAHQKAEASRVEMARRHQIEAVMLPNALHPVAETAAQQALPSGFARLGIIPVLDLLTDRDAGALEVMSHPAIVDLDDDAPLDALGYTSDSGYRDRVLLSGASAITPTGPVPQSTTGPLDAPTATGGAPFFFLSYAHSDWPEIEALVGQLQKAGIRIWRDTEIKGGEEWDHRLEYQIETCAGILAVVSRGYTMSKYCRRELKFADALDKPIVAVRLDQEALHHGLAMLFASLQFVDITSPEVLYQIKTAIADLAEAGSFAGRH